MSRKPWRRRQLRRVDLEAISGPTGEVDDPLDDRAVAVTMRVRESHDFEFCDVGWCGFYGLLTLDGHPRCADHIANFVVGKRHEARRAETAAPEPELSAHEADLSSSEINRGFAERALQRLLARPFESLGSAARSVVMRAKSRCMV